MVVHDAEVLPEHLHARQPASLHDRVAYLALERHFRAFIGRLSQSLSQLHGLLVSVLRLNARHAVFLAEIGRVGDAERAVPLNLAELSVWPVSQIAGYSVSHLQQLHL